MCARVINTEPIALCDVRLNSSFKKLTSETVYFRNDNDIICFDFNIIYPTSDTNTKFTVRVKFLKDNGERRITYRIDEKNNSIINMTIFNVTNGNYNIFGGMKKVTEIAEKSFYIEPVINVYDNMKKVNIILYHV